MIIFTNPSLIDLDAALLMGVNAKTEESPIGWFGTGLKFAIATLLRNNCSVTLYRDGEPFVFHSEPFETRGKAFSRVLMNDQRLGFTTDLGRSWKPWQAYRELYSNAKDEQGKTRAIQADMLENYTIAGCTVIAVEGDAIEQAHATRDEFLLNTAPLIDLPTIALHHGSGNSVFYRGIRVAEVAQPTLYRYNIKHAVELTEDRTLAAWYKLNILCVSMLNELMDADRADVVKEFVLAKGTWEAKADFDWGTVALSERTASFIWELGKTRRGEMNATLLALAKCSLGNPQDEFTPLQLSAIQQQQVDLAVEFCRAMGFAVDPKELNFIESGGVNRLGMVIRDTIYITREAFEMGTKMLAGTIIEEFIHKHEGLEDCCRGMQNRLFNMIVSLGEEHVWKRPL